MADHLEADQEEASPEVVAEEVSPEVVAEAPQEVAPEAVEVHQEAAEAALAVVPRL